MELSVLDLLHGSGFMTFEGIGQTKSRESNERRNLLALRVLGEGQPRRVGLVELSGFMRLKRHGMARHGRVAHCETRPSVS